MTSKEPFCTCVVGKVSLTSRVRKIWSSVSYQGKVQLLIPPATLENLSTGDELCTTWGPSISCLRPTTLSQLLVTDTILPWAPYPMSTPTSTTTSSAHTHTHTHTHAHTHTHTHTPGSSNPTTEAPGTPHSQGPGRQSPGRDMAWSHTRKFCLRAHLCGHLTGCLRLLVLPAPPLLVTGEVIM